MGISTSIIVHTSSQEFMCFRKWRTGLWVSKWIRAAQKLYICGFFYWQESQTEKYLLRIFIVCRNTDKKNPTTIPLVMCVYFYMLTIIYRSTQCRLLLQYAYQFFLFPCPTKIVHWSFNCAIFLERL